MELNYGSQCWANQLWCSFNSMNTPNAAVCVSSGVSNVIITANQFATSGYHTGALINNGTNVVNSANLGA